METYSMPTDASQTTALERLAEAILDGRVRIQMDIGTGPLGIPTGATFYLDVDPNDTDEDEAHLEIELTEDDLDDDLPEGRAA
jgi:hypothetical protein